MSDKDPRFYIQVDVGFWDHPKARAAGRDGRDLYLCSLGYSRSQLTDGAIHAASLELLAFKVGMTFDEARAASDRLVDVGLWIRSADGWQIHDYDQHQQTREDIDRQRALWRKRQGDKRARDQQEQPGHPDVTRDSPVSHPRVTRPEESQSQRRVRKESVSQSKGPLGRDLAQVVENLTTTTSLDENPTPTTQALHIVATRLAQRYGTDNPQGYRTTILRNPHDHLPDLERIAQAHPELDPDEIADLHLTARDRTPTPRKPKCGGCGQDPHDGGIAECPTVTATFLLEQP